MPVLLFITKVRKNTIWVYQVNTKAQPVGLVPGLFKRMSPELVPQGS